MRHENIKYKNGITMILRGYFFNLPVYSPAQTFTKQEHKHHNSDSTVNGHRVNDGSACTVIWNGSENLE